MSEQQPRVLVMKRKATPKKIAIQRTGARASASGAEHIVEPRTIRLIHTETELICIPARKPSFVRTEEAALTALQCGANEFEYSCVSIAPTEFMKRFNCIHPELFLHPSKYQIIRRGEQCFIRILYEIPAPQIPVLREKVVREVDQLAAMVPTSLSPYERLKFIYDWFCRNITYNRVETSYNYCCLGVFLERTAVCAGISQAFMMVCRKLRIPCGIALGSISTTNQVTHEWNVVKLGDAYYHVDVTCGINMYETCGMVTYPEFCVRESILRKERFVRYNSLLPESDEYTYPVQTGQYIKNRQELKAWVCSHLNSFGALTIYRPTDVWPTMQQFVNDTAEAIYCINHHCRVTTSQYSDKVLLVYVRPDDR